MNKADKARADRITQQLADQRRARERAEAQAARQARQANPSSKADKNAKRR